MCLMRGDFDLDIHLAVEIFAAIDLHGLSADVHEAVARELEWRLGGACGRQAKCQRSGNAQEARPYA
jgi:hypothetical protein